MRLLVTLSSLSVLAAAPVSARCFDFSQKVVHPLRAVPAEKGREVREGGKTPAGRAWVGYRSQFPQPVSRVLQLLLDHNLTKGEADEAVATLQPSEHYLALQNVKFRTTPVPLIKLTWTEEWAYALKSGTVESPEEIVINYEKTDGTHFIQYMCGSIVVRRTDDGASDVYWFEEAQVTQRSAKDMQATLESIFNLIRAKG